MILLYFLLFHPFGKSLIETNAQNTEPPISISIDHMKISGKCQVPKNYIQCLGSTAISAPCGKTCYFNPENSTQKDDPPTFEYTFKGEKYQIYGKYDIGHGKVSLYLDDVFVTYINQYTDGDSAQYALQYTSDILPYGYHTIKIKSLGERFEIYKFAYWPSIHARRLNSTEIMPLWNIQSDQIGGLKEISHKSSIKKTHTIQFSKIWVYGATDTNNGDILFSINSEEHHISQKTSNEKGLSLLYESEYMPLSNYTISFSNHRGNCALYCIYYLATAPPLAQESIPTEIILNSSNCNVFQRCKISQKSSEKVSFVSVHISSFKNFRNKESGGAIHISNCGLNCRQSTFCFCKSEEAGGAIFIRNDFGLEYTVILERLSFVSCAASCGGACFVFSSSIEAVTTVNFCSFKGNEARGKKSSSLKKFGGSAFYLSAREARITNCRFMPNKGKGGSLKIVNDFNEEKSLITKIGKNSEKPKIFISKCVFEVEKDTDCSLFYARGKKGPSLELSECEFKGLLADGAHYIDGQMISKNSPELFVKGCRFASSVKKAISFDVSNLFLSVDVDSLFFEGDSVGVDDDEDENSFHQKWKILSAIVIPVVGLLLAIVFFVIKNMNNQERNGNLDETVL